MLTKKKGHPVIVKTENEHYDSNDSDDGMPQILSS